MADAAVAEAPPADAPETTEAAPAAPAVEWAPDPRLTPPAATPPATETPLPDEAPAVVPDAASAEPPAEVPEWKAKLDAGDPDFLKELLSHAKVAGHVGTLADNLARQKADQAAKAVRDAELDQAAQADPDNPLAQARLAERQAQVQAEAAAATQSVGVQAAQEGVAEFLATLPEDARAEIAKLAPAGKPYGEPGDVKSGLRAYMADVVQGAVAAEVAKAKAGWEKDTLPGLRKEVQAELLGKEPSPDLGTTAQTGAGSSGLTAEKYAQMAPAELRKLTSTPAGRAQIDAMWASAGAA